MGSDVNNGVRRLAKHGLLERNRPFVAALGASLGFHLMMVTVFAVEIRFPIEYMDYYPVYLMEQVSAVVPQTASVTPSPGVSLRKPSSDTLVDTALAAGAAPLTPDGAALSAQLPSIEMPRLQSALAAPAPSTGGNLQIRSEFGYLLEEEKQDSWARFTGEMQGLGSVISRLTFGRLLGGEGGLGTGDDTLVRVGMPAPGVGLYVKWQDKPKDRKLMFAPPNRALWGLDAGQLSVPVTVAFSVDSEGQVVDVEPPVEDEAGIAASAAESLEKSRFAPVEGGRPTLQHGVLIVAAEPQEQ